MNTIRSRIMGLVVTFAIIFSTFSVIRIPTSKAVDADATCRYAIGLICSNEGGYDTVNPNDEGAVSIGKLQWHGNNALNLLKTIIDSNPQQGKDCLGSSLYNEIVNSSSWASRTVTTNEKALIQKLLVTSESKTIQDQWEYNWIMEYVQSGIDLGLSSEDVIVYYADMANQGVGFANGIAKIAMNNVGSYSAITLDDLHNSAMQNQSKYFSGWSYLKNGIESRRIKSYNYCSNLIIDTEGPSISEVQVYNISTSGYDIAVRVTDNGSGVSKVRFPTWTVKDDQDDIIWADGEYIGQHAYFRVNTSDHNNELGWYRTHIYAYDNAGNMSAIPVWDVLIENENPIISEVEVYDISTSGYTVRAKVVDTGSGIHKVQFPTWTLANDQDDLVSDWGSNHSVRGTFDGDYVSYRVNTSDHNNELGKYRTHIYAYDESGNVASTAVPDVFIENEEPKISDVEIFDVSESGYSIRAKVSDSGSGINRVQFPTWTKENGQDDIFANWQHNVKASGVIEKDTVTYRVNVSDHNDELGIYHTHIYVYDNCGNCRQFRVEDVDLSNNEAKITLGDCNGDGEFNISDIVVFQNWLLGRTTELENWKAADLCEDSKLDVFDLCLMRRKLIYG